MLAPPLSFLLLKGRGGGRSRAKVVKHVAAVVAVTGDSISPPGVIVAVVIVVDVFFGRGAIPESAVPTELDLRNCTFGRSGTELTS